MATMAVQTQAHCANAFEIFRDPLGRWCARRTDGLVFGTFFERMDAIGFARRECRDARRLRLIEN
jgi:hypothetical protein